DRTADSGRPDRETEGIRRVQGSRPLADGLDDFWLEDHDLARVGGRTRALVLVALASRNLPQPLPLRGGQVDRRAFPERRRELAEAQRGAVDGRVGRPSGRRAQEELRLAHDLRELGGTVVLVDLREMNLRGYGYVDINPPDDRRSEERNPRRHHQRSTNP